MKKKIVAITLGLTMALSVAACGNQASTGNTKSAAAVSSVTSETAEESTAKSSEELSGGWETNQGSTDPDDSANSAAKKAFEKAASNLDGYDYELVAYLGSQVVAGTNYSYLVKGTPVTPDAQSEYMILVVYEDLEGNASVTETKGLLDVSADEDADGGWSYNQGAVSLDNNADVKKAFDKAMEKIDGADYDPIAYIGSQTVSGTNYAVLCSVTPVTPDAERSFCLVTIYEDLEGNAEMTDAADVDLSAGAYEEAGSAQSGTEEDAAADNTERGN